MSLSIIQKQLALSRTSIPNDVINIIKDYAFYNIEAKSKVAKNIMVDLIRNTSITTCYPIDPNEFIMWIQADPIGCRYQFQPLFCGTCYNYLVYMTEDIAKSIKCKCIHNR